MTSDVAGATTPQPASARPHEPIRALLRAGKNDEAIVRLAAIVVAQPDDLDARELLFDAFFQKREWLPALALAEELVRRRPDVARLQKALIATLSNMKRFDEAILRASQYTERHGEELTILDALKVANFYTGKIDEAIRYGQRGIEIRDAEAAKIPRLMTMTEPRGPPLGDNVISFSLWGPAPFYSYGAMINLVLCRTVYPGWACRFYVDATVPQPCVAYLRDNGADVRRMEDEYPGVGLFQRFLVMNDRTVRRFLVRDCDGAGVGRSRSGAALDRWRLSVSRCATTSAQRIDDRLPGAGRTGADRYRRADAALFRRRPDGEIRHDQRILG